MFIGLIFLCVAGPLTTDTQCMLYVSDGLYKTEQQCRLSVKSVLKTPEFEAIVKMPEYDTEYRGYKCTKLEE